MSKVILPRHFHPQLVRRWVSTTTLGAGAALCIDLRGRAAAGPWPTSALGGRRRRLSRVALVTAAITALADPQAVLAGGGSGGAAGSEEVGAGGNGGDAGQSGQAAPTVVGEGGSVPGGTGGTFPGGNGGNGNVDTLLGLTSGGGGGAAGISSGFGGSVLNSPPPAAGSGGRGGDGGSGGASGSGGGGGGTGGDGFLLPSPSSTPVPSSITNNTLIAGGSGGAGGTGGFGSTFGGGGGNGGDGGAGMFLQGPGRILLTNNGTITGGSGGAGGAGGGSAESPGPSGLAGLGGVGISGGNLAIVNSGTISGGMGRGGQANAITFTGGVNSLTITGTSVINGNVVAQAGDTFALGGATAGSFNMALLGSQSFQNFGQFQKTGTSSWTLTGGPSLTALPWTIVSGTLDIGATSQNATTIDNSGGLIVGNGGSLSSTGITNNSSGNITVAAGGTLNSSVTNAGTFAASGTASVTGNFNNAGTITLQNNAAGDRLAIGGNYVGSPGSRILLDFSTQTARADQVIINGSASGSTAVSVLNLTPLAPFTTGATLIQAGSIAPGTFTLANAQNFGTSALVLLPQNGGAALALGSIPSVAGLSSGVALTAAQTIAFQSSDVVFDHIWEVRNAFINSSQPQAQGFADEALGYTAKRKPTDAFAAFKAPPPVVGPTIRPAVWVKGWGDYVDQNVATTINFGGQNFSQDLSFRQRSGGVLTGADALIKNVTSANDALLLGALLGYTNSHVDLKASPTSQNYDGGNLGVYATYLRGNWFTDLMFKTDLLNVSINGGGINQKADLINYDVSANIGYKFDLPNKYYIEPTAGIEYVSSNFSGATAFSPTTIALNDGDATRGRIGARVGTEFIVNGVRIEPSLLGYVYSIFNQTGNALVFSGTGITLPTDVGKVRGEIQAAVNFFNLTNGVSGFVRADTRFGDNLTAGGVRVGLRYQM